MIVRPVLCKPFVGRREELAYLRERRLEAGSSHGGLVLVAGDAGVGKSRLIAEFCGSLAYSRWRIGAGACLQFGSRPYGPLLDALARVEGGPFAFAETATQHERFDAIAARIATIAAKTALVLTLEDVHWADAATLDFLAYVGDRLRRMRVLVLLSYRTHDLHPDHPAVAAVERIERNARAGRIELGPLRGGELRTFIDEALAGIALTDETRRAIATAGDGNPFFTEELLKSAVESDPPPASHAHRSLPRTVRATLLERLHPFDERERRIVAQAAVIGRTFELALLAATLSTEPHGLVETLRRARDFQLIEEVAPAVFRFRHGLTREAIYGDFLGAEVRPRHRAIARALEAMPDAERSLEALAYHWWAAGDAPKTIAYNERAGDAAVAVHAHDDAIVFYERARDAAGDARERGSLTQKMAERHIALGATRRANLEFERAADTFRDAGAFDREAGARVLVAITDYTLARHDPIAPLEAMLARLDASEVLARGRVHLGIAWLTASFWFPTRAAYHLARVDARALASDPENRLRFHNVSAWVAMTVGDPVTFRTELARWLEAAHGTEVIRNVAAAHYNGAMCLSFFGAHEEALAHIERASTIARDARLRQGQETAHATAAMCHLLRGDLASARAAIDAIAVTSDNQKTVVLACAWGLLLGAYLDDAALVAKWFDPFESDELRHPELDNGAAFAEILVRRGRARDARRLLERALPACELVRGAFLTLLAAGRYGSSDTRDRARALLARAAAGATEMPETFALALFDARLAREAGDEVRARALARDAAEGFGRLRFPLLEAEAHEAAGDLDEALAIFRSCGATYDVRRLAGRAEPAAAPATPHASVARLSAREREIVRLAVAGRSNVQIARELSITHKTVEKHLGSAYQKLGVSSRLALRALVPAET